MKIVRKEYFNEIEKWWNSNTKEALIVLGPFGVGKTTLIFDWAQSKKISYKYFAEKEYERIKEVFNKSNNNFFNFDLSLINESSSITSIPNLIIFDGVKPGDELLVQIKDICSKTNHKIVIISDFDEYVFKDLRFIPIGSFKKINVKPLSFKEFCSIKISDFAFKAVITSFNLYKQENIYLSDQFEELWKLYSEFGGLPNVTSILFDKGKNNVTGLCDALPIREHLKIYHSIYPFKKLGFIYNGAEKNSITMLKTTQEVCDEMGIELLPITIYNPAEVNMAAESLVSRVDAFYVVTDNTLVSGLTALITAAANNKKPIFSEDYTSAVNGGILYAIGFDYYKAGRKTGKMAVEILKGKSPDEMPVTFMEYPEESVVIVDMDRAQALNIEIPKELITENTKIIENNKIK